MKEVTVYVEAFNNIEWGDGPELLEITFYEKDLLMFKELLPLIVEKNISHVCWHYCANYEMLTDIDNINSDMHEYLKVIHVDEEKDIKYVEFEPEYRVSGSQTKLWCYGDETSAVVQVSIGLKHSPEEIWCDDIKLEDLLQQIENN